MIWWIGYCIWKQGTFLYGTGRAGPVGYVLFPNQSAFSMGIFNLGVLSPHPKTEELEQSNLDSATSSQNRKQISYFSNCFDVSKTIQGDTGSVKNVTPFVLGQQQEKVKVPSPHLITSNKLFRGDRSCLMDWEKYKIDHENKNKNKKCKQKKEAQFMMRQHAISEMIAVHNRLFNFLKILLFFLLHCHVLFFFVLALIIIGKTAGQVLGYTNGNAEHFMAIRLYNTFNNMYVTLRRRKSRPIEPCYQKFKISDVGASKACVFDKDPVCLVHL